MVNQSKSWGIPAADRLAIKVAVAAFLFLGGCAPSMGLRIGVGFDDTFPPLAVGDAAPVPSYQAGQYFSYDNNRTNYVVGTGMGQVFWKNNRGMTYRSGPDFTRPYTEWRYQKRRGAILYRTERGGICPLQKGNGVSFTARNRVIDHATKIDRSFRWQHWFCEVGGDFEVTVKAGTFATTRIDCKRRIGVKGVLHRRWYYAPAVGHYVLREDHSRPRVRFRRIELVSYGMSLRAISSAVKTRLRAHVQAVLEKNASHEDRKWRIKLADGSVYSGSLFPTRTYRTERGFWCRDYQLLFRVSGREHIQNRTACRDKGGKWVEI